MDYIVNVDGVDILIERNESSESQERLLKYYVNLLKANGAEFSEEKERVLQQIVDNMTEMAAQEKIDLIGMEQIDRITSYVGKLKELTDSEKDTANALEEVLDVAIDDAKQESKMINGNKFLYEKGTLDIEQYCKKLYDIGEETKGNTWTLYIDEEGELVIY